MQSTGLQGQGSLRRLAWRFSLLRFTEHTSKVKAIKKQLSIVFPSKMYLTDVPPMCTHKINRFCDLELQETASLS